MTRENQKTMTKLYKIEDSFKHLKQRDLKESQTKEETTEILQFYDKAQNLIDWRKEQLSRA